MGSEMCIRDRERPVRAVFDTAFRGSSSGLQSVAKDLAVLAALTGLSSPEAGEVDGLKAINANQSGRGHR